MLKQIANYLAWNLKQYQQSCVSDKLEEGCCQHEFIVGLLFELCRKMQYIPICEYRTYAKSRHSIDIVWVNDKNEIVLAFEVDQRIRKRNYDKLNSLPEECEKVLVSFGNTNRRKSALGNLKLNNLHHIGLVNDALKGDAYSVDGKIFTFKPQNSTPENSPPLKISIFDFLKSFIPGLPIG